MIPSFTSLLRIWKLTSDSSPRKPFVTDTDEDLDETRPNFVEAKAIKAADSSPYLPTPRRLLRGAILSTLYEQPTSTIPKPVGPTIAMPNKPLPFRNLSSDGEGSPGDDESSCEESIASSDENIETEEGAEQPARGLPIGSEAESSARADRTLNSLLELGSNQKQLLSLLAKSFKKSPVGDYLYMA
jgi:hypothetical protein